MRTNNQIIQAITVDIACGGNAGAGNDTITINASNIDALERTGTGNRARIDGGGNIDTIAIKFS
jgi:hypothetical protein